MSNISQALPQLSRFANLTPDLDLPHAAAPSAFAHAVGDGVAFENASSHAIFDLTPPANQSLPPPATSDAGVSAFFGSSWLPPLWPPSPWPPSPWPPIPQPLIDLADQVVGTINGIVGKLISKVSPEYGAAIKQWSDTVAANSKTYPQEVLRNQEKIAKGLEKLAAGDVVGATADLHAALADQAFTDLNSLANTTVAAVQAVDTAWGFEPLGRGLRPDEVADMKKVFGDTIDLSKVVVKEGFSSLFSQGGSPLTMGNTIYMQNHTDRETLIHEASHVWQFQNGGASYMLRAATAQLVGSVTTGSRNAGYQWWNHIDQGWGKLNPEEQAKLIEDAFKSGYFTKVEKFPALEQDYINKLNAYQNKAAIAASSKGPQGNSDPGMGMGSGRLGGGPTGSVPQAVPTPGGLRPSGPTLADEWREVLKAQKLMEDNRPVLRGAPGADGFFAFSPTGRDYTRQLQDALAQLRHRAGAPTSQIW